MVMIGQATTMVSRTVAVHPIELVTCIWKIEVSAAVGVPLSRPLVDRVSPSGGWPSVTTNWCGANPSVATSESR